MSIRRMIIAVGVIGLGLWFGLRVWPEVWPYASHPIGLIFSILDDSTVYAPGFTHRKFFAIKPGMTREEVERVMGGPPLNVMNYPANREIWNYSWFTPRRTSHWRRAVGFTNGRVTKVVSTYYID